MSRFEWLIVTGEYPPDVGGVGDYTRLLAYRLARDGDAVTVAVPPAAMAADEGPVAVLRLRDHFGFGARADLDRWMSVHPDAQVLVQYVPHAFGWKAMNVPFCVWLWSRRARRLWVMFHEVAYPTAARQSLRRNVLGFVTSRMAALVGRAAECAFVSTDSWEPAVCRAVRSGTPIVWTPVPSVIDPVDDAHGVADVRRRLAAGSSLVGHVGTYGELVRPLLVDALTSLLRSSRCQVLLMGRGSGRFAEALVRAQPNQVGRVVGVGTLPPSDLSRHVSACDFFVQPYPDGVSTRRTTAMIALAHGRALVTTSGALTERCWSGAPGVVLTPAGDPSALGRAAAAIAGDPLGTARLGHEARRFYDERFDVRHTVSALRLAAVRPERLRAAS